MTQAMHIVALRGASASRVVSNRSNSSVDAITGSGRSVSKISHCPWIVAESKAVAQVQPPVCSEDAETRGLLPSIRLGFVPWLLWSMLIFLDI